MQFLNLAEPMRSQPPKSFVLDGEIVALDADGRSNFTARQRAKIKRVNVHFYALDLINLNGTKLVDKPLTERQRLLLAEFVPNNYFHLAGPLNGSLDTLLEKIPEFGLEVSLPSA